MSKPIHIFSINKDYTRCEVWHGSRMLHNRLGTSVMIPDKGLTRKERYEVIAKELADRFGLLPPGYRTSKRR